MDPVPVKQILKPGDNKTFPKQGERVTVHFTVYFQDGRKIDSSRDRNYPFAFNMGKGNVIKGWEQEVPKMSLGQRAVIVCSSDLAYGANGIPGVIPANTNLKFDIQLLKIG